MRYMLVRVMLSVLSAAVITVISPVSDGETFLMAVVGTLVFSGLTMSFLFRVKQLWVTIVVLAIATVTAVVSIFQIVWHSSPALFEQVPSQATSTTSVSLAMVSLVYVFSTGVLIAVYLNLKR